MIQLLDQDFSQLNHYISDKKPSKILFLVDENTHEHCLPILLANFNSSIPFEIIEIESGENNKNIDTATQLWEICSEFGLDRKSLIVNLGGGVITDMGGFVASTYKRGINFINIPTTLLAMCDASIGGKTGIDHQFLKNIIGTFATAEKVFIYPEFLETLAKKELLSGFAEMLKHALIADENHWKELTKITDLSPKNLSTSISTSINIKKNIVEKDFKEQSIRKNLNFGHTIGHSAESFLLANEYAVTHGECVAMGMICELNIAMQLGLISGDLMHNINQQLQKFYTKLPINSEHFSILLELMKNDKKSENNVHLFSLIDAVGSGVYNQKVKDEHILHSLDYYVNLD